MNSTLIAACGTPIVSQVRKTFPADTVDAVSPVMRRRGRLLAHGARLIAELPPADPTGAGAVDVTAELAFYLGALPSCTAVLLLIPAPALMVADRIVAPGQRELLPDLLEPASRLDPSVQVATITHPTAWVAAEWALRRVGPHQLWVVGMPAHGDTPVPHSEGSIHRGLRSILDALEQQAQ